jgi:hypothetical protein
MSTHSPFPWTAKKTNYGTTKLVDATGVEFGSIHSSVKTRISGNCTQDGNVAMITAIPGLLMAAMRGHGWGDPLHQLAKPHCAMCMAIRQAIGPLTRKRVIELAKMDPDHVSEMIFDERWDDVWMHLGIARNILGDNNDLKPDTTKRYLDGEYDGLAAELIEILPTL